MPEDPPISYRSSALGAIDVAYNLCRRLLQPKTHYWFSEGFGDLKSYYELADRTMAEWKRDGLKRYLGSPLKVSWQPVDSGDPAVLCDEGSFASPLAAALPEEVRTARFLFVRAAPGGTLPPTRCVVVQTAATGVVDYADRDAQMARPLLEHGLHWLDRGVALAAWLLLASTILSMAERLIHLLRKDPEEH